MEYARGDGSQIDGSFAWRVTELPCGSSELVRTSRPSLSRIIFFVGRPDGKRAREREKGKKKRERERADGKMAKSNADGRETSRTLDLVLVNCSPFISATFCFPFPPSPPSPPQLFHHLLLPSPPPAALFPSVALGNSKSQIAVGDACKRAKRIAVARERKREREREAGGEEEKGEKKIERKPRRTG